MVKIDGKIELIEGEPAYERRSNYAHEEPVYREGEPLLETVKKNRELVEKGEIVGLLDEYSIFEDWQGQPYVNKEGTKSYFLPKEDREKAKELLLSLLDRERETERERDADNGIEL